MALPWLIGAAVVGLGAAIVKAVSDDDSSSSSSSSVDTGEERRRREAAALKQLEQERDNKRSNARVLFAEGGARLGDSLSEALDGVADIAETRSPSFVASLGANGYTLPPAEPMRAEEIKHALREPSHPRMPPSRASPATSTSIPVPTTCACRGAGSCTRSSPGSKRWTARSRHGTRSSSSCWR